MTHHFVQSVAKQAVLVEDEEPPLPFLYYAKNTRGNIREKDIRFYQIHLSIQTIVSVGKYIFQQLNNEMFSTLNSGDFYRSQWAHSSTHDDLTHKHLKCTKTTQLYETVGKQKQTSSYHTHGTSVTFLLYCFASSFSLFGL